MILIKLLLSSRKGVGTALGSAFFIIIVALSLSALFTMSIYEAGYQEVRDQMTEQDIDRMSEELSIRNVEDSIMANYSFDMLIDNIGGAYVNTARIYVYDQTNKTNFFVCDAQNGTGAGFINGTINLGEVGHRISVDGTDLYATHKYRIVLATDRGRQFSYSYPPTPYGGEGDSGKGYALIIADVTGNFQYQDTRFAYHVWKNAWMKIKSPVDTHPLFRVLINNTTEKDIVLQNGSYMLTLGKSDGSQANLVRYIVSKSTDVDHPAPTPFDSQIIPAGSSDYVWFAMGEMQLAGQWIGDSSTGYFHTSFTLCYNYLGETEERILSLPACAQKITDPDGSI